MWFVLLFMLFCRCGVFRKKNKMTLIPSITILLQWPLPAFIIKVSNFADFEQVIIKISHFSDFELWSHTSNTLKKTPLGESGCLGILFWGYYPVSPALHPDFSGLWRPAPALSSTPTLGVFFECLGIIWFLIPHMWLTGHHAAPEVTHTHT